MSRREVLLAVVFLLATPLLIAQVPPEERIPIRDPERLESRGFRRDSQNVYVWSRAVHNRSQGNEAASLRPEQADTWGKQSGYSSVTGCQLQTSSAFYDRRVCSLEFGLYEWADGGPGLYYSPVQVPEGALLESVRWWAYDNLDSGDLEMSLDETCQPASGAGGATVTQIASASTSGSPGPWFASSSIGGVTASNHACTYTFQVRTIGNKEGRLRFHKAVVQWARQVSPAPATARFSDVSTSHPYFQHIEALFESGITSGCQEAGKRLAFCPDRTVTRGEMAVFLARALGLSWP